ncbi:MAG: aspartate 1-decarboxylase [Thermodesulfobacteriota bacterium]
MQQRIMLKSKIHRATVTGSNVDYEGSIAIDEALMEIAGILPFEQVQIYNVTNGERFETYTIKGARDSGTISINGAAAHLANVGDIVIVASYFTLDLSEARRHKPMLVYVDADNCVTHLGKELAGVI